MNKTFERENNVLLKKLREIRAQLDEITNCVGKIKQQPASEIQKKILEIKVQLKELKNQYKQSMNEVKKVSVQKNRTIEEKVKDLEIKGILQKEAKALDIAVAKVARAEKYCNSTLNKVKVNLLSAELSYFEVIKANLELDKVIHQ